MQQKNAKTEYQQAYSNILQTASWLNLQATKSLKPFSISPQQFHILRVLLEFHPQPATVKILTERMTDKMSNASRLIDKLKQKGLVEREASEDDRRRVNVFITPDGVDLLEKASQAFEEKITQKFNHIQQEELTLLINLLNQLRG